MNEMTAWFGGDGGKGTGTHASIIYVCHSRYIGSSRPDEQNCTKKPLDLRPQNET